MIGKNLTEEYLLFYYCVWHFTIYDHSDETGWIIADVPKYFSNVMVEYHRAVSWAATNALAILKLLNYIRKIFSAYL